MWPAVWPGVSITRACERADFHGVALADGFIDQRDALRFVARRDDAALVRFLQLRDAAGVVAVMVRHQDVGQPPAGPLERRFDRRRLGRIDRGGRAACRIVDEHAEIVGEADEEVGLYGHLDIVVRGRERRRGPKSISRGR